MSDKSQLSDQVESSTAEVSNVHWEEIPSEDHHNFSVV